MKNTIKHFTFREKLLDLRQEMRFYLYELNNTDKTDLANVLEKDIELLNSILFEENTKE